MSELKKVSNDFQLEVTKDDIEIDVEVNYRCFFAPNKSFYPMNCIGSIYKGRTLEDFKQECKKDYEKQYEKVEIVDVFIGL